MCRAPTTPSTAAAGNSQKEPSKQKPTRLLLASIESFEENGNALPETRSLLVTGIFVMTFLFLIEMTCRQIFTSIQHWHPILEDETNRNILARHIGVDTFSCFAAAYLGYQARHAVMKDVWNAIFGGKSLSASGYEPRLFVYAPQAARLCIYFFAYQVKNTIDTILWQDGWLFIAHHILTLITVWGAMSPGFCQYYAPFFIGMSEVSTGVLCLLANFDDVHGVVGLADAFPAMKMILGAIFAVLFITFRVVLWCAFAYYCFRDMLTAKKFLPKHDAQKFNLFRPWINFFLISLGSLSLLQVIWLGEIFRVSYEEASKMGFL